MSAAVLFLTLLGGAGSRSSAQALVEHAHSLRSVPADAAFYSASLRLKEQMDIFMASNAYRRLMEIPLLQMGKMQLMFQFQQSREPMVARFREYFNSAEGQEAFALVKEMFTDEVFLYGDKNVASVLKVMMELNGLNRASQLESISGDEPREEILARKVREFFDEHANEIVVPNIVWGFRIKDADRLTKHLDRIQELLQTALEEDYPDLAESVTREQIADNEFVVMSVDGSMIPWDEIREKSQDQLDPEELARWEEILSKKKATVALGSIGEFVLLSIGESADHLAKLGDGPALADEPNVVRLAKHADQRVTSIAYVSKEFAESMSSPQQQVDELVTVAEQGLDELEVEEDARAQLMEDIRGFGNDMLKYFPEPGDTAAISFLTPRGYESFQYQTGTRPLEDSSEPLSIIQHLGGSPLLFGASRTQESLGDYDQLVTWLKRIGAEVEQIAKAKTDPEEWAHYLEVREKMVALLEQFDNANRNHLIPALADGQQALVVDVAAKSKQWHQLMPRSPEPLPILEAGLVVSVSDPKNLREGFAELFDIVQQSVELVHELHPDQIPDFQLPAPETKELDNGGTMFSYPMPEDWGLDEQLVPNAALADDVAAASLTRTLTERLLRTMPPQLETSLDLTRPASLVSYFDFAKLIDFIRPWVDYGGAIAMGQIRTEDEELDEDEPEEISQEEAQQMMMAGMVLPQINQVLDVASAMRSFTAIVYREDDAWVTHSEAHLRDLP